MKGGRASSLPLPRSARANGSRRRLEQAFTLTIDCRQPRIVLSRRGSQDDAAERLLTYRGRVAARLLPVVYTALHNSGERLSSLEEREHGRYRLREAAGARLALTLWALAPLKKPGRASVIRDAIAAMSDEEVYYWFSRAVAYRGRALQALRILLAGE